MAPNLFTNLPTKSQVEHKLTVRVRRPCDHWLCRGCCVWHRVHTEFKSASLSGCSWQAEGKSSDVAKGYLR